MNRPLRILATTISVFFALALGGCINVDQDLWINKDGSGRLLVDLAVSKEMAGMLGGFAGSLAEGLGGEAGDAKAADPFDIDTAAEKKKLEAHPNVTKASVKKTEDEKWTHFVYDLQVDDVTKLKEIQEQVFKDSPMAGGGAGGPGPGAPEGEFVIEKLDSGNYKITAELKGEAQEGGEEMDAFARGMMKQMFGDAAFTFRVHAPAESHNGTETDGAVEWKMPLVDLATGKSLSVTGEFAPGGSPGGGLSPLWIALIAIVAVGLILFFFLQAQKPKLA